MHIYNSGTPKRLVEEVQFGQLAKRGVQHFLRGRKYKNQVSNYLLRALLLALGSGQCRTVLNLGCLAKGGLGHEFHAMQSPSLSAAGGIPGSWACLSVWYGGDFAWGSCVKS